VRKSPAGAAASFDILDATIGERVRARRRAARLTQAQLARSLGVTAQQLQKYETGANRISASTLIKLAAALGASAAALVGEDTQSAAEGALFAHLATAGAVELLRAFSAISDPDLRQQLVSLARDLSARPLPSSASPDSALVRRCRNPARSGGPAHAGRDQMMAVSFVREDAKR